MLFLRFALIGLATGAIYGLLSQGLVLIYRGSGLLNFAQGAVAMFGAYAYYEFTERLGWPTIPAATAAIALCGVLGAGIQCLVLRPMRKSSAISRVIATLGIVLILQSTAYLAYGHNSLALPSLLPTETIRVFSNQLLIGQEYLYILAICLVLAMVLFGVYRFTAYGRITTAVAEHEVVAASLGYSPNAIAMLNWSVGSMLAGLAGVLIAPIILLQPTSLVLLVVPAMAAALIGDFRSFPITFAAALALGVAQSEMQLYVSTPGWPTAAPFLVVIAVLIVRGRSLPLRSLVLDRLPSVGTGRIRMPFFTVFSVALCVAALLANANWSQAIAATAAVAIVGLSVTVLTGYAGQLSLAQYVLAGVGALLAARFAPHMPFLVAVVLAALATGVFGGLVGLPAMRTRGITLAVVTLSLGSAVAAVVLENSIFNGSTTSAGGLTVPIPDVFGWNVDPVLHGNRYALLVVVVLLVLTIGLANLRRSGTGRQLLAVRSNERAAASLGVNVPWVKTYAFMIASAIAAVGGIMLAFMQPTIEVTNFDVFSSLVIVVVVVVGGVGYLPGAYIGALFIAGGVVSQLFSSLSAINDYLPLVGGLVLLLNLVLSPDGLFELFRGGIRNLATRSSLKPRNQEIHEKQPPIAIAPLSTSIRVEPRALRVSNVSVSFGGVNALNAVSLEVHPGEVLGLIGPNGAGKTTLIDAITGFVQTRSGKVELGDELISNWSARRRAVNGLSRSFQSLELFNDLNIAENLAVAENESKALHYATDFLRPGRVHLGQAASEALRQLELVHLADRLPTEISFGQRKTVAIARSIASSPSVLLLDEPAAGLDDHEAADLGRLIRKLADAWGIALILVEHKVDMIMATCDRVTVLDNGSVLASGTPDEVISNPAVLDAYLGAPNQEAVP